MDPGSDCLVGDKVCKNRVDPLERKKGANPLERISVSISVWIHWQPVVRNVRIRSSGSAQADCRCFVAAFRFRLRYFCRIVFPHPRPQQPVFRQFGECSCWEKRDDSQSDKVHGMKLASKFHTDRDEKLQPKPKQRRHLLTTVPECQRPR